MGTQGPGRKRIPNRERLSAEDDALNQVVREAEARLAAKRAARAEARDIRMKELEKHQHREVSDDEEKMSVGSRSSFRPSDYSSFLGSSSRASSRASSARASPVVEDRGDRDFLDKASRTASTLSTATLASLGGASSRRGSCDTNFSVETEASVRDMKDALVETEEKYRKAMVFNAQLHNQKSALMYQVDALKEELMDLEEELWEERRRHDHALKEFEQERASHNLMMYTFKDMKESLRRTEELLRKHQDVIVSPDVTLNQESELVDGVQDCNITEEAEHRGRESMLGQSYALCPAEGTKPPLDQTNGHFTKCTLNSAERVERAEQFQNVKNPLTSTFQQEEETSSEDSSSLQSRGDNSEGQSPEDEDKKHYNPLVFANSPDLRGENKTSESGPDRPAGGNRLGTHLEVKKIQEYDQNPKDRHSSPFHREVHKNWIFLEKLIQDLMKGFVENQSSLVQIWKLFDEMSGLLSLWIPEVQHMVKTAAEKVLDFQSPLDTIRTQLLAASGETQKDLGTSSSLKVNEEASEPQVQPPDACEDSNVQDLQKRQRKKQEATKRSLTTEIWSEEGGSEITGRNSEITSEGEISEVTSVGRVLGETSQVLFAGRISESKIVPGEGTSGSVGGSLEAALALRACEFRRGISRVNSAETTTQVELAGESSTSHIFPEILFVGETSGTTSKVRSKTFEVHSQRNPGLRSCYQDYVLVEKVEVEHEAQYAVKGSKHRSLDHDMEQEMDVDVDSCEEATDITDQIGNNLKNKKHKQKNQCNLS
ncbi:leucine-rich repeat flightless-interacting protein 1 isoform X3 [Cynoglossus semilaevis]|uniref:leucine-rich repeat flightless-interacting protein 1 isoform X3 n=1 Tax=Cynoglossus semilaevis TaxID=244447 RepID=UPI00049789FE|nr:leucine-rich repeat flightless-interacting protein 1-like isoform X3 [Cynoglossus semilaevis]